MKLSTITIMPQIEVTTLHYSSIRLRKKRVKHYPVRICTYEPDTDEAAIILKRRDYYFVSDNEIRFVKRILPFLTGRTIMLCYTRKLQAPAIQLTVESDDYIGGVNASSGCSL